ncbi:metallophosphoesterase [Saccharopolyspora gregorii]|uniref:Calcineurin-like phosphoesterase domain-containing protein n=1 Tax=Saccharopolyspora gregorii TaxID=33914 RepID=A0ABP6RRB5_9PSEU
MKPDRRLLIALAATGLTAATAIAAPSALAGPGARAAELPDPGSYDAAIAWIPDTQYYSETHPEHFDAQTRWLVDNAAERKIGYATHTGDIVDDSDDEDQWKNADASMKVLDDAKFPYGVVEGNHDVDGLYADYFGDDRFAGSPVRGESFENNRQHYDLVDVAGEQVMMLSLTWDMQEADFAWAEDVLAAHPDTPVIISVHAYLETDGSYSEQGQEIFDRIVEPHRNVKAVLCGHNHGATHNVKDLGGGRTVPEILADYQSAPEGGLGYLRLLQFDVDAGKMIVDTYSPSEDDSNYFDGEDDFTVDVDLNGTE